MTEQTQQDTTAPDAGAGGVTPDEAAAAYAANDPATPDAAERPDAAEQPEPQAPGPRDADPAASDAVGEATAPVGAELLEEPVPDPEQRAAADPRTPGQLLEELEEAQAERAEYLDALQRSRAEFDNFRRRSAREAAGAREAGVGDLATRLLDVLDDLDRTVAVAADSADDGLAGGIGAVHRKLTDALVGAGVERIDEVDVPFDATRHEAVQQVPADEPVDEPQVAQVLRPGYTLGSRCLRPAMVAVRQ